MTIGFVRYEMRIERSAAAVWQLVGDPARLHEWFPGITSSTVEGSNRTIVTGSGLPMPEEILCNDPVQRRFAYRITVPMFKHHRGMIDVIDLHDGTCLVVYSTEADPRTMALTIAGGTADALDELKRIMESPEDGGAN